MKYANMGKTWVLILNSLVSAKKGEKIELDMPDDEKIIWERVQ